MVINYYYIYLEVQINLDPKILDFIEMKLFEISNDFETKYLME